MGLLVEVDYRSRHRSLSDESPSLRARRGDASLPSSAPGGDALLRRQAHGEGISLPVPAPEDDAPHPLAGPARALATTTPPRRGLEVLLLTLTKDGRVANDDQVERLARAAGSASDCFLFCHGWLHDEAEARQESARFFALLDGVLAPLRERIVCVRLGLHWPSKPFADPAPTRGRTGDGLWPELERRFASGSRGRVGQARLAALRDLWAAEIPRSPEEEAELDALARRLGHTGSDGEHLARIACSAKERGAFGISPLHALSFWVMKRRAGEVGERFGRECVAPLWRSLSRPPRLHLIGHSFGAKLVTSIPLGGARAESLLLLLAAFSAFAFAAEVPGFDRPGFYHQVLAERRVDGSIVVLRSDHDRALGTFYQAVTGSGQVDRRRDGARGPVKAARAAAVAASALGAVGARGVGAPELDLLDVQRTGIPCYPIVNVDGSRVVKAHEAFVGAHRDIFHREVAALAAMAAGLLVGGPEGARPRPVDPLVHP